MAPDEVRRLLGRAPTVAKQIDPFDGRSVLENYGYAEATLTFTGGRLTKAVYSAPDSPTGRGIAVGATLQDVYEVYGRPHYRRADYLSYQGELNGTALKVAFNLRPDHRVAAILVSGTEKKTQ